MPHFIIIDPCLFSLGGHEVVMDHFMCQQAQVNGYEPLVLAHKNLDASVPFPCLPIFEFNPYHSDGANLKKDQQAFRLGNQSTFATLQKVLPSPRIAPKSVVVLHTACANILLGVVLWLSKLNRPDISLKAVFRWSIGHRYSSHEFGLQCFKQVFTRLKQLPNYQLFVDSNSLQQHFQEFFPQNYAHTPIGVHFTHAPILPTDPPKPKKRHTFVFAGTPYKSKGGTLLCPAIRAHCQQFPEDRFCIHVCGLTPPQRKQFENLPSQQVMLTYDFLHGAAYHNFIMQGDILLIPYNPKDYALRTSHILIEALGMGKAVIVSPHPWLQEQVSTPPVGIIMKDWSARALAQAMREIKFDNTYREQAWRHAPYIRNTHNPIAWFSSIMNPSTP